MPDLPTFVQLDAPPAWRTVEFISDLHLQAQEPATFDAWRRYMRRTPADAVFILGDLFEVWIGDDAAAAPGFAADCAMVLKAASTRIDVFFMTGNRDFLVGDDFLRDCGVIALADPTVLHFLGQRWLLTHGDALCTDDTEYMQFRERVRDRRWQQDFLSRPLAERQAMASDMRERSEERKRSGIAYADVTEDCARDWLKAADAQVMIHGHTHRPADHVLGDGQRVVLSDWDAAGTPPRLQAMRLAADGLKRIALD